MVQVELVKIFLASPSDVSRERDYVQEVVEEINRTTALSKGVMLQVVRSEKDTSPGYGGGGQNVLISQIGNMKEYKLFVGLMWNRLGTPTPRAESGTVEEYEQAVATFEQYGKPDIWFYFREAPAQLNSESELEQRRKVLAFKRKVQSKALTHDYENPDLFRERFRHGLSLWLSRYNAFPETFEAPLKKKLVEVGADKDEEIIEAAQKLNQTKEQSSDQQVIQNQNINAKYAAARDMNIDNITESSVSNKDN